MAHEAGPMSGALDGIRVVDMSNPAVAVGITLMGLQTWSNIWVFLLGNLGGGALGNALGGNRATLGKRRSPWCSNGGSHDHGAGAARRVRLANRRNALGGDAVGRSQIDKQHLILAR